jgi:DHA3 family tetracycline resistance protein-like MFS transporter
LIGYWISGFLRGGLHPILFTWSNRQISGENSGVRATVLSMWSQADALGQIAGGPAVGAIGNTSIRLAMTASGLLVGLKLPLYVKANRM